jgi:hypothetical protein
MALFDCAWQQVYTRCERRQNHVDVTAEMSLGGNLYPFSDEINSQLEGNFSQVKSSEGIVQSSNLTRLKN